MATRKKEAVSYEAPAPVPRPAKRSRAHMRKKRIGALDFEWCDSRTEDRSARVMMRLRPAIHEWIIEYCRLRCITQSQFLEGAIRREVKYRRSLYDIPTPDGPNAEREKLLDAELREKLDPEAERKFLSTGIGSAPGPEGDSGDGESEGEEGGLL